ncbi:MAG: hypothetical protein JWN62_3232 [Acidimicrobiales bacterium]|nr:hypothetical protein [Acidimicrobiales bacterium]
MTFIRNDRRPAAHLDGTQARASLCSRRLTGPARIALTATLFVGGLVVRAEPVAATGLTPVGLGAASTYSVLSGASVANTLTGPATTLRGDLGVAVVDTISGFPPGVVVGTTHNADSQALTAKADLVSAYNDAAGRTPAIPFAGDLIGQALSPGVYHSGAAVSNTGILTLDAGNDPNAVFIFQVGGALSVAAATEVKLINGAQSSRVFWQVNGAATLGATAKFAGTIMALDAISVGAGATVYGRILARNGAVTLNSNNVYTTPPALTITGGATPTTNDSTPTIAGSTDVSAGQIVLITVAGQSLSATVQTGGSWAVTAAPVSDGAVSVTASVSDTTGSSTTATQTLTIDTVLPIVAITGGVAMSTNDATPTIGGTTDVGVGATVTVTVAGQTLTVLVQAGGAWNATPTTLGDGVHAVVASVTDLAGNVGTSTQSLTIDTTVPIVVGGSTALTNDATPTLTGVTDVGVGATVTVTIAGQTLTATVQDGGTWSVTAATIVDGTWTVVASATDMAGNTGSATQTLTIDTTAPALTVTGGAAATTTDSTPTVAGLTNIAPGQIVTVTVSGQSLSAAVQAGGTWSVTAATISNGTYSLSAVASDPAGNSTTATQWLTVDTVLPLLTISGGATASTNDPTPTIDGTTDVGVGRTVTIAIAGQTLTALVQAGGSWNVTPSTVIDGAHTVAASATDLAGNVGTTTQLLTIDTVAPTATITGGATVLTNDSTPSISGTATADVAVGSTATVTVAGQTLTTTVHSGGLWTVTATTIADGNHTVTVSVTDAAGNPGSSTQSLTIDTVPPTVTIDGGAAMLTSNTSPTITGRTDAPTGATVTVRVAGQVLTALVQGRGTWNTTPGVLADGGYDVSATVSDQAGNNAATTQLLTVHATRTTVPDLPTLDFTPVGPKRLFDTRAGQSPNALRSLAKRKIGGINELQVQVTGLDGYVPTVGVGAVSLNLTATNSDGDGFITVYACGTRESVSSLNYTGGHTVANAIIAPVSGTGMVCIFSSAPTDIVADINGWFASGKAFTSIGPKRLFDTRPGQSPQALLTPTTAKIQAGSMLEVKVTDIAGIVPTAGVGSVSLNVTATDPAASGFITAYDCGTRQLVSSVNYAAGATVANAVLAPVSATGTVCFFTSTTTDLIVDINGWIAAGRGFTAISPQRVLDTRADQSPTALRSVTKVKISGERELRVNVTDLAGYVPASGVEAVSLNVVAIEPDGDGYITVYTCGTREAVSSLNYTTGQTVANAVLAPVSASGTICLYSQSPADVIVDIDGWFSNIATTT